MKTWNAPEMEELDVRMTLTGSYTGFEESHEGYVSWWLAMHPTYVGGEIPEWTSEAWMKDHNDRQTS